MLGLASHLKEIAGTPYHSLRYFSLLVCPSSRTFSDVTTSYSKGKGLTGRYHDRGVQGQHEGVRTSIEQGTMGNSYLSSPSSLSITSSMFSSLSGVDLTEQYNAPDPAKSTRDSEVGEFHDPCLRACFDECRIRGRLMHGDGKIAEGFRKA